MTLHRTFWNGLASGGSSFVIFLVSMSVLFSQQPSLRLLSGTVLSERGTPLAYTNITVEDTEIGAISDLNGFFSLNLPDMDTLRVTFHYIGYESKTVTIDTRNLSGKPIRVVLKVGSISFSPIKIIGESSFEKSRTIEPSLHILRWEEVTAIPSIGGGDVFRTLQTLPGVSSSSELSNQLYVRGGTPDQNLVLINGVPVYQPFHLFGLSSSVDDASIDYVRYYSGGFSVRYGDRMSAVLDIVTKPGSDSLSAYLDWNLLHTGGTASGPLGERLRWRITGRRTYFDALSKLVRTEFPYYYYDVEAKLSYLPTPRSLVTVNTFVSGDNYGTSYERVLYNSLYGRHPDPAIAYADSNRYRKINKSEIGWTNRLMSLRWMSRHSPHRMSEVTVYFSTLDQNLLNQRSFVPHPEASNSTLDEVEQRNEQWDYSPDASDVGTHLSDFGIDVFHEWNVDRALETSLGGGYSLRNLNYGWNTRDFDVISPYVNVFMDFPPDSMDFALDLTTTYGFGEMTVRPTDRLWVRGGIRITGSSAYADPALDPRVSFTWALHPGWRVKAAWGRFSQSLSSSVEYGFYSIASLYFPNERRFPLATHALVRLTYDNIRNLRVDFGAYRKVFSNLLYVDRDGRFRSGPGESYGVELLGLFSPNQSLSTQLAYGYAVTTKTQDGETFYPNFDQRHKLNWQLTMKLGRGWDLGAHWTFASGRPANLATSMAYTGHSYLLSESGHVYYWELLPIVTDLPKNVFRYPPFHRLDVVFTKKWRFRGGVISTYLQVLNLYNRKNVVYYEDVREEREKRPDPDNPGLMVIERRFLAENFNGFPIFPTIGMTYEF